MKRLTDVLFSAVGLLLLTPLLLLIMLWVWLDAGRPVFFWQERVGKGGKHFRLLKFRSMRRDAERLGQLTLSGRDPRVTRSGYYLRKYKLDEFPQLWNVLKGEMSVVGPRPEVPKYVDTYTEEQRKVLSVRPGMTDTASLEYIDENDLLAKAEDPERYYREEVLPRKLRLQLAYVEEQSWWGDLHIILRTVAKIIR